jgi:hypothetical protein
MSFTTLMKPRFRIYFWNIPVKHHTLEPINEAARDIAVNRPNGEKLLFWNLKVVDEVVKNPKGDARILGFVRR